MFINNLRLDVYIENKRVGLRYESFLKKNQILIPRYYFKAKLDAYDKEMKISSIKINNLH